MFRKCKHYILYANAKNRNPFLARFRHFFPLEKFLKKVLYNRHIDAYNALPFPIELQGDTTQQLDFGISQRGVTFSVCFPEKFLPNAVQFSQFYKFNQCTEERLPA